MRKWLMASAMILPAIFAILIFTSETEPSPSPTVQNVVQNTNQKHSINNNTEPVDQSTWPLSFPEVQRVPLLDTGPLQPAAQSLTATRHGDPRSPPIQRDAVQAPQPTAAELADPKAYQRFEANQHQQLLTSFAAAAQQEVPRLQADIARAKQLGIDPASIAKIEEKAKRLAALEKEIRERGQLE